jgi:hypothetical protein
VLDPPYRPHPPMVGHNPVSRVSVALSETLQLRGQDFPDPALCRRDRSGLISHVPDRHLTHRLEIGVLTCRQHVLTQNGSHLTGSQWTMPLNPRCKKDRMPNHIDRYRITLEYNMGCFTRFACTTLSTPHARATSCAMCTCRQARS